tara:strand:+ start:710 stop:1627 length:918 start_codon:yes stop_codon:yes gene_type:complete
MEIERLLRDNRPNVRDTTINNYLLNLKKIFQGTGGKGVPSDLNFLKDITKLNEYFKNIKTDTTRKNSINVAIVFLMILSKIEPKNKKILKIIEDLDLQRTELNKNYTENLKTNKKSEKQEKNWLSVEEIDNIANGYKNKDYQAYAIIKFHLGVPLRNDLPSIKIMTKSKYNKLSEAEKKLTNAMVKTGITDYALMMNNYKTSGAYMERQIDIPPSLNPIIRKLIKMNGESGYLIVNPKTDKPFTTNEYTRYLNSLFKHTNKKISSTLLRNIVVSDKFGAITKEMKQTAKNMLHSSQTQQGYIKTD